MALFLEHLYCRAKKDLEGEQVIYSTIAGLLDFTCKHSNKHFSVIRYLSVRADCRSRSDTRTQGRLDVVRGV